MAAGPLLHLLLSVRCSAPDGALMRCWNAAAAAWHAWHPQQPGTRNQTVKQQEQQQQQAFLVTRVSH
jgi:hypothetical protein